MKSSGSADYDSDRQRVQVDFVLAQQMSTDRDIQEKPISSSFSPGITTQTTATCQFYLKFDTTLPAPILPLKLVEEDRYDLPPAPDLSQYTCPLLWSPLRKNVLLALSCFATFLTAYSAGSYSPPSHLMADDLGASHLAVLVGITTFCIGFAVAPMLMAPLSEIWGRRPVFLVSGVVYVVFQLVCSFVPNLTGMLISRFLVGVGGSVFSSIVGGVIADLWDKKERNTPMALFSGAVLAGTGAGPLVASAMVDNIRDGTKAWKWSFWHQVIMDGLLVAAFFVLFSETRASVVLRSKAQCLNQWYIQLEARGVCEFRVTDPTALVEERQDTPAVTGACTRCIGDVVRRPRWTVKADEKRTSLARMIVISTRRPFHMLLTEPVVFCFSLWAAFAWGVLYLSFSVVPFLYSEDFSKSSRVYIAMIIAAMVASIAGIGQERLLQYSSWRSDKTTTQAEPIFWAFMRRRFPTDSPEARLYFSCITTLFLPLGLYGAFMSPSGSSSNAQAVGLGFATWGIYSVYLSNFNYLADTYHIYASSALAAQSFCRNIVGGSFPLLTSTMFKSLGLRGVGGMLGGIATLLTVIPWVLVFFGGPIRARSKFAIALESTT